MSSCIETVSAIHLAHSEIVSGLIKHLMTVNKEVQNSMGLCVNKLRPSYIYTQHNRPTLLIHNQYYHLYQSRKTFQNNIFTFSN